MSSDHDKRTALYSTHEQLGATFTDFGGWHMPLRYGSEIAEHRAVRETAGLFDLSHMGEIEVRGPDAAAFLDYALAGKLSAIAVGRAKYSMICTSDGGVIDDLISYRLAEDDYLVVPNAGNSDTVASAFSERASGFDVNLTDASRTTALIAVQGPAAQSIVLTLVAADDAQQVRDLRYYAAVQLTVAGIPALVARTGYTGEDGFELFVEHTQAQPLWAALEGAGVDHGLAACGLACRDSLRLEAGMPLYGNELSRDRSPFEAGLGPVVALSKPGDFVGKSALQQRADAGEGTTSGQRLVALKGQGRRAARAGYAILDGDRVIGEVTSGQPSPTLGYPIALAYLDVGHAVPGTVVGADIRGKVEPFEVVDLPFYRRAPRA
ncbi:MAG: glycine cleavage system aminomethyltransferase GcvT [Beutenbergiaceae bacterium]